MLCRYVKWHFFDPVHNHHSHPNRIIIEEIDVNPVNSRFSPNVLSKSLPDDTSLAGDGYTVASKHDVGAAVMQSVDPQNGQTGDLVTIYGSGIPAMGNLTVFVGPKQAEIVTSDEDSIIIRLPENTVGTYQIDVFVLGFGWMIKSSNPVPSITYDLSILSVEPLSGSMGGGQIITLTGYGFSSTPSHNRVNLFRENRNMSIPLTDGLYGSRYIGDLSNIGSNIGTLRSYIDAADKYTDEPEDHFMSIDMGHKGQQVTYHWVGILKVPVGDGGTYQFKTRSDDGSYVFVNEVLVVNLFI